MCADILVGRDAFFCSVLRDESNNDIKRKHGTRIVDWLHWDPWENRTSIDVSVYVH